MTSCNAGIYGIYCTASGKWYVGQAQNLRRRFQEEKRELRSGTFHNPHMQSAWNKYGEKAFSWRVLALCLVPELDHQESAWIEKIGSYTQGYNMTKGGGGARGYRHTDAWRQDASIRNSNGRSPRKGVPISDESKERMRVKALGANSVRAKSVQQLTPDGTPVAIYGSIADAARQTGAVGSHISEVCNGKGRRKTAGGFRWRWEAVQE